MAHTPFADEMLARTIAQDSVDALQWVEAAQRLPGLDPAAIEVAGGHALVVAPGSPLNGVEGLGFGDDPFTPDDLLRIEKLFAAHDEPVNISVCPLGDLSVPLVLGENGYAPIDFENVLYLNLDEVGPEDGAPSCAPEDLRAPDPRVSTHVTDPSELKQWAAVVARGFATGGMPTPVEHQTADLLANRGDATHVLGMFDDDPAGTGRLAMRKRIAYLNSDSTLPQFRGRGIQSAVLRSRIWIAKAADCDVAIIEATPGSKSQRNMERQGFRVAWTTAIYGKLCVME